MAAKTGRCPVLARPHPYNPLGRGAPKLEIKQVLAIKRGWLVMPTDVRACIGKRVILDGEKTHNRPEKNQFTAKETAFMTTPSPVSIYQLKITLRAAHPPIWRRVSVPGRFNLQQLHQVIQVAMGWEDCHLHQFVIDGEFYGQPTAEDCEPVNDEQAFTLEQIAPSAQRKFIYEYDFGDDWLHDILVEDITPPSPGQQYPQCLKGKRACPPEDVGGLGGYEVFLEVIQDKDHVDHDSYLEWIGGGFDPDALDLAAINQALCLIK